MAGIGIANYVLPTGLIQLYLYHINIKNQANNDGIHQHAGKNNAVA